MVVTRGNPRTEPGLQASWHTSHRCKAKPLVVAAGPGQREFLAQGQPGRRSSRSV